MFGRNTTWWLIIPLLTGAFAAGCGVPEQAASGDPIGTNTIFFATHMGEHPGWIPAFEAIVRRYEAMYPGLTIKLHYQPLDGYQIWAETQFISGRGPDILDLGGGDAHRFGAREGLIIPLTERLYDENPYAPGMRWRDTFYPVVWNNAEDPIYGELWAVPFNFFTLRVFYNKELFAKAGIERTPKTWTEFMRIQQQLLDAGIVPYLMPNSNNSPHRYVFTCIEFLSDMMFQDRVPGIDLVIHDGQVDGLESNISIYTGKTRLLDPQMLEIPRLMKQWSRYWVRGFNGLDRQQAKMMFANGIGAMYLDGSWETEGLTNAITFDWGVFPMPTVTKETTLFADGPRNDSNYNLSFAIGKVAERRGHLAQVVDFLQFLTGPEAADTLSHYISFISALRDYPVPERLQAFAPDTGHPWSYNPWSVAQQTGSTEAFDELFSLYQGYLAGEIDEYELVAKYEEIYHSLTVEELGFALKENATRVEETERRIAETRAKLDSLAAHEADDVPDSVDVPSSERSRLRRQLAWQELSLEKARRQYEALRETLSRPPVWASSGSERTVSQATAPHRERRR